MNQVSVLLMACTLLACEGTATAAVPNPLWSSDEIIAGHSVTTDKSLKLDFQRRTATGETDSGTIVLTAGFTAISGSSGNQIDDFVLCRVLNWKPASDQMDNQSCYADPAFRLAELANRRALNGMLAAALPKPADKAQLPANLASYWYEQELAFQDKPSSPLTQKQTASGSQWLLGDHVVVHTSNDSIAFTPAERPWLNRYLARHVDLHPQIRAAILASGQLPAEIVIERMDTNKPSTETFRFSAPVRSETSYPLPPHLTSSLINEADSETEAAGLHQTALAIIGTALPSKPSSEQLIKQMEAAGKDKRSMEVALTLYEFSQQYGGALTADPSLGAQLRLRVGPYLVEAFKDAQVAALDRANTLAGSSESAPDREEAARFLTESKSLDALPFGTFRYVTFANLMGISGDTSMWNPEITKAMPNLPDCYWKHIAAYPWASNAFHDLGDYWYKNYEVKKAWQAWDLGRAVDPDWQLSVMSYVSKFEEKVRILAPDSF
jgi:hypothetical protein